VAAGLGALTVSKLRIILGVDQWVDLLCCW
jgi:hypothetical protein